MKKLIAGAVALTISGSAMAAGNSVGFAFGTNFYKPSTAGFTAQNGQNFTISWALDNDISLGVYNEVSNVNGGTAPTTGTLTVNAIQVAKGVMKNVSVGLNLGAGTNGGGLVTAPVTAPLADVYGAVNILSGSGDKVSGALTATVAARYITTGDYKNGVNLGLAVGIMF